MAQKQTLEQGGVEAFDALLVEDLASFIGRVFRLLNPGTTYHHNWHIEMIAHYLEKCEKGELKRLVITLPPRNLKSICVTVAFTAWILGRHPELKIVSACYSDELSEKFGRMTMRVMETRWFKRIFRNTQINPNKRSGREFETTRGGSRLATSMGGMTTGRGGDVFIIDDPIKAQDVLSDAIRKKTNESYENSVYTRLDSKVDGVIIVVMQRLHVDDPVAYVLDKDDWLHINLPAIAEEDERFELDDGRVFKRKKGEALNPAHEPLESLAQTKRNLGSRAFAAQYQQRPVPIEGNLVKRKWFGTYDVVPPASSRRDKQVQSWDPAMTDGEASDYTACTTWEIRGADYYLIDVSRWQVPFAKIPKLIEDHKARFAADTVIIEKAGVGEALVQIVRRDTNVRAIAFVPRLPDYEKTGMNKIERLATQSPKIEAGHVYLPRDAHWLDDFLAEILAFPHGKNDDQVDSFSQFLMWVDQRNRGGIRQYHMGGGRIC